MGPVLNLLRSLLAVVVGYLVLVVLITLVQEVWFGGVGFYKSSLTVLMVAGFFTFLSASRVGHSDLGVNKKRAEKMTRLFKQKMNQDL